MTQSLSAWLEEQIAIAEAVSLVDPVYKYWYEAGAADFNAGIDPTMIETRYAERLSMPDSQPETRWSNQIYRDAMTHASLGKWFGMVNNAKIQAREIVVDWLKDLMKPDGGNNGQPG